MEYLLANTAKSPYFDEDPNLHKIKLDPDREPGPHNKKIRIRLKKRMKVSATLLHHKLCTYTL
jgi:hypothetical protein